MLQNTHKTLLTPKIKSEREREVNKQSCSELPVDLVVVTVGSSPVF